jgi:SAM-dependent methyltransferase
MKAAHAHSHTWIVGVVGLGLGLTMLVAFPRLKVVGGIVLLVALFHLVGFAVLLASVYAVAPRRFEALLARFKRPRPADALDFGWSWGAMNGHWIAAGALTALAFGLQLEWPALWPAWLAIVLLAGSFVSGGFLMRSSKDPGLASLPLVDLVRSDHDLVLDAGCGAGRTSVALARVLRQGRIVALDRFDAAYIQGGGRDLLEHNLRVAGLGDRVQIEQGDVTKMSFADATFDAAVSAHMIDHLGPHKAAALQEVYRVLKPGARFLMVVWVPGWTMFTVANVVCLTLTRPAAWRTMARAAGFTLADEGTMNGLWFAVLEKPTAP